MLSKEERMEIQHEIKEEESGRIGYFILWLLGAPVGLLLLLWALLGNNIFGAG